MIDTFKYNVITLVLYYIVLYVCLLFEPLKQLLMNSLN